MQTALICVASQIGHTDYINSWRFRQCLLLHASRCEGVLSKFSMRPSIPAWITHRLGDIYSRQGRQLEAEILYTQALRDIELTPARGPNHRTSFLVMSSLGMMFINQDRLVEAEAIYLRALEGLRSSFEQDAEHVHDISFNLGLLYSKQDRLKDAEPMYLQALQGYKALCRDDWKVLYTLERLGELYRTQDRLAEAEAVYIQTLQHYKFSYGIWHPATIDTISNLGLYYFRSGKFSVAESLYNRVLKDPGYAEALRSERELKLAILNMLGTLGQVFAKQGKFVEAETMYNQELRGCEEILSPQQLLSHRPALNTMFAFGDLLSCTGRKEAARAMYTRALNGFLDLDGPFSYNFKDLEGHLKALQLEPTEIEKHDAPQDTETVEPIFTKRRRFDPE